MFKDLTRISSQNELLCFQYNSITATSDKKLELTYTIYSSPVEAVSNFRNSYSTPPLTREIRRMP